MTCAPGVGPSKDSRYGTANRTALREARSRDSLPLTGLGRLANCVRHRRAARDLRRARMQPAANAPFARKRPAPPELLQALSDRFQERCSTGQAVRERHGRDESPYDTTPPDCVVFPTTSEEVAEVVLMCARHR